MRASEPSGSPQVGTLLIAVALVAVVAGVVLAPPLGELIEPPPLDVWPELERDGRWPSLRPEPTELVRYAIAALAPLVVAALVLLVHAGPRRIAGWIPIGWAGTIGAVAGLALIAIGWADQAELGFAEVASYFDARDLLVASLLAGAVAVAATTATGRPRLAPFAAGSPPTRPALGLAGLVAAVTVLYVTPAVYTTDTLGDAPGLTAGHIPSTLSDFAGFGNGATPLADFASQYTNVLPWVLHPVLDAGDYTPASFTVVMGLLSVVALLALWRTLALAVGNEWVGAALYLPVLALGLRPTLVEGDERVSNASLFQIMPVRYVLPLLVAWLCARHLRGHRPHAPIVIFGVAGLALLNNPELGGPCLAAAFVAVLVGGDEPPLHRLPRVAVHLLGGIGGAAAVVTVTTLARSGSLPDPRLLTYFSRLFGAQGFGLQPMPGVGFHLILYVTFVSALLLAAARRAAGDPERGLWGMLAFAGTFGLGAGVYYAGRSNAITLVGVFPAWGLALALVAWASVRWLLDLPDRRRILTPVGGLALCALVGLGLAATNLTRVPSPWTQVQRLTDTSEAAPPSEPAAARFVADRTTPGEPVLILRVHSHRVARGAGVRNVAFIGHPFHVIAESQLDALLDDLRAAGGTAVFVGEGTSIFDPNFIYPGLRDALRDKGWDPVSTDAAASVSEWRLAG